MAKTVRVHDDTHAALKKLKVQRRVASLDEVIREAIRDSIGAEVGEVADEEDTQRLTSYIKD